MFGACGTVRLVGFVGVWLLNPSLAVGALREVGCSGCGAGGFSARVPLRFGGYRRCSKVTLAVMLSPLRSDDDVNGVAYFAGAQGVGEVVEIENGFVAKLLEDVAAFEAGFVGGRAGGGCRRT